ncbi:hypothetical protein NC652_024611 [Populus alba x Populus x berolinensis]|uniref:Uncharacterized protein n=1 Tax=Populus alba TaxID=43335 RepID=A0ACC4BG20_POPAL|nr:hypothetical protein NC652_024611 [Populus alba x Populus x berolinensis]
MKQLQQQPHKLTAAADNDSSMQRRRLFHAAGEVQQPAIQAKMKQNLLAETDTRQPSQNTLIGLEPIPGGSTSFMKINEHIKLEQKISKSPCIPKPCRSKETCTSSNIHAEMRGAQPKIMRTSRKPTRRDSYTASTSSREDRHKQLLHAGT